MEAADILTATHELEESGMTRPQSEAIAKTIVAAVEPLATRSDLKATKADLESGIKSLREQMATKADLKSGINSLQGQMATKADLDTLKEHMVTKSDLESLKEHLATKKDVESVKVWFLLILLGVHGSALAIFAGMAFT